VVDADERHIVLGQLARDAEHGAVAADDDRGARLPADLGHGHHLDAIHRQMSRGHFL